MKNNYKVSFYTQNQEIGDKTYIKNSAKLILPNEYLHDMGVTKEERLVKIDYDDEQKRIYIEKA